MVVYEEEGPMIAGKTYDEILLMKQWTRVQWYKMISKEDKKEAMQIVELGRRAKVRISKIGKSRTEETKNKIGISNTGKIRTEEHKAKISAANKGENNPMYGKTGEKSPFFGRKHTEETKAKIGAVHRGKKLSEEQKAKLSVVRMGKYAGENHPNFKNWSSRAPYCYKWNEPLRERYRNYYGRVCVLSDVIRSVMGLESGLDDFEGHEIFGKQRLSVHHIRGDKMAGCNGNELALVPLQGGFNIRRFNGLRLEEHPFYITLFLLKDIERKHRKEALGE